MPKATTRKITTAPADKAAKQAVAKAATAARAVIVASAATDAAVAALAAKATPATNTAIVAPATPAIAVAKPARGITRTAATIVAQRTHFAVLSDRDTAYLAFFNRLAARNNGTVTMQAVHDAANSGETPNYAGSCKANDAGVRVRLHKAGRIINSSDGLSFTIAPMPVPTAPATTG